MNQFPSIQINGQEDINPRTVNMLQKNIIGAVNPLLALPLSNSNLLENIQLTSGPPQSINHGLGRVLRGWFTTRISASTAVNFVDDQANNPLPEKTLLLSANANCTISLIVF